MAIKILGRVGLVLKGDWGSAVDYDTLDVVTYDGNAWAAKQPNKNVTPSAGNNGYWQLLTNNEGLVETVQGYKNDAAASAAAAEASAAKGTQAQTAIAPTFDPSTAYTAGTYVWYSGTLYKFTSAHAAGEWTGADAKTVPGGLGGEIANNSIAINDLYETIDTFLLSDNILYRQPTFTVGVAGGTYQRATFYTLPANQVSVGDFYTFLCDSIVNNTVKAIRFKIMAGDTEIRNGSSTLAGTSVTVQILQTDVDANMDSVVFFVTATLDTPLAAPCVLTKPRVIKGLTESIEYAAAFKEAVDHEIETSAAPMIAPVETSSTASAAHAAGTYFIYGDELYRAIANIANGGSIVISGSGQNCEATTVCGEISYLRNYVTPEMYGAKGDGISDDSDPVKKALSIGLPVYFKNTYKVTVPYHNVFHTFNGTKVKIFSSPTSQIILTRANEGYDVSGLEAFIEFSQCADSEIDINITGDYSGTENIGYYGISGIFVENCENVKIKMNAQYVRYGVRIGNFKQKNISKNICVNGTGARIGYFVAAYGVFGLKVQCVTNEVHRSVYVAGGEYVDVDCTYTCQYIADCNVLFTTDYYGEVFTGVKNANVIVRDAYSATQPVESKSFGLSCQRTEESDAASAKVTGFAFENISAEIYKQNIGCALALISVPYDVFTDNVVTNNIVINMHDIREVDNTNRAIRTIGDYAYKMPVELRGQSKNNSIINSGIIIKDGDFGKIDGNSNAKSSIIASNSTFTALNVNNVSIDDKCVIDISGSGVLNTFKFNGLVRSIVKATYENAQANVYNTMNGKTKLYVLTPLYTTLTFYNGASANAGSSDSCSERFTGITLNQEIESRLKVTSSEEITYLIIVC